MKYEKATGFKTEWAERCIVFPTLYKSLQVYFFTEQFSIIYSSDLTMIVIIGSQVYKMMQS